MVKGKRVIISAEFREEIVILLHKNRNTNHDSLLWFKKTIRSYILGLHQLYSIRKIIEMIIVTVKIIFFFYECIASWTSYILYQSFLIPPTKNRAQSTFKYLNRSLVFFY